MEENTLFMLPMNLIPEDEVNEGNLPEAITRAMDIIKSLEDKLKTAIAEADYLQYVAKTMDNRTVSLFKKKESIEKLQEATVDIIRAQVKTVELEKVSFQYQRTLGTICNYLFDLGLNDIAMTRTSINILQKYLKNASEEEISDTAKKEIVKVVSDLKAREDLMKKYTTFSKHLKDIHNATVELTKKYNQLLDENKKIKEELNEKNVSNKGQNSIIFIVVSIVALIIAIISLFM